MNSFIIVAVVAFMGVCAEAGTAVRNIDDKALSALASLDNGDLKLNATDVGGIDAVLKKDNKCLKPVAGTLNLAEFQVGEMVTKIIALYKGNDEEVTVDEMRTCLLDPTDSEAANAVRKLLKEFFLRLANDDAGFSLGSAELLVAAVKDLGMRISPYESQLNYNALTRVNGVVLVDDQGAVAAGGEPSYASLVTLYVNDNAITVAQFLDVLLGGRL